MIYILLGYFVMGNLLIVFMLVLSFNMNASEAGDRSECSRYKDWVEKYKEDPITEDSFGFCSTFKGQILNEVPLGFSGIILDQPAPKIIGKKRSRKRRLAHVVALAFLRLSIG